MKEIKGNVFKTYKEAKEKMFPNIQEEKQAEQSMKDLASSIMDNF